MDKKSRFQIFGGETQTEFLNLQWIEDVFDDNNDW